MNMNISLIQEVELELELDYTPLRPAPACQDPDSPRFSDSGDAEEFEILKAGLIFTIDRGQFTMALHNKEIEFLYRILSKEIIKWCRIEYEEQKS